MATLRRRKVTRGEKEYRYWVVDVSVTQDGKMKRKQRHFQDKQQAELFKAEIERQIARAKYSKMEVPMGPPEATLTEWLDRFAKAVWPNCSDIYHRTIVATLKEFREFLEKQGVASSRKLQRERVSGYAEAQLSKVKCKTASNKMQIVMGGRKRRREYITRHFSDTAQKKEGMKDLTFHGLRHTCATRLAAAGMNPFDVQRVMGHQSIKTTMIYVNLAEEQAPDMNIM